MSDPPSNRYMERMVACHTDVPEGSSTSSKAVDEDDLRLLTFTSTTASTAGKPHDVSRLRVVLRLLLRHSLTHQ